MLRKIFNQLKRWRIERLRMNYDNLPVSKQILVQNYYDNYLSDYWEDKVLAEGACHYDDVDRIMELAWEWYLEH